MALVAGDSDNDDDEDGGDSLLMVYALEKNETCNIRNKSTNESHIIIGCLIDKDFHARSYTLKPYEYALLFLFQIHTVNQIGWVDCC